MLPRKFLNTGLFACRVDAECLNMWDLNTDHSASTSFGYVVLSGAAYEHFYPSLVL